MKNFGNLPIFGILNLVFFCTFPILGDEVSFQLNANTMEVGDILILEVKHTGDKELKPKENRYQSKDVQVYYIGNSYETQIINFKVSKSQVLKYQISTNKIGSHSIPTVQVLVNNQLINSPELKFSAVAKTNKKTPLPSQDFFSNIFGETQTDIEVSPPEVIFHTSKSTCYVGEPIIGYYILYYNQMKQPFLERDPNQSISFPFFLSETLDQVTIQIDPVVQRDGIEKRTLVYGKEIYGLTPLRVGTYTLGATYFIVGDSLRFGAGHDAVKISPQTVRVSPLPSGAPKSFDGAIGEYDISAKVNPQKIHLGETYYFAIRVFGEGVGIGIDDPLKEYTSIKGGNLHFIRKEKSKQFQRLADGTFGFYATIDFFYSIVTNKEGYLELPSASIVYFSPKTANYESKTANIPSIFIHPKRDVSTSKKVETLSTFDYQSLPIVWIILIGFMTIATWYAFKIFSQNLKVRESMILLNGKIGTKKGVILKDYLIRNGVSESNATALIELQNGFPNENWLKIYHFCGNNDKKILMDVSNHLTK